MVRFEKKIIERDSCHIFNEWKLEIGEFNRVEHDDDDDDDTNDGLTLFLRSSVCCYFGKVGGSFPPSF